MVVENGESERRRDRSKRVEGRRVGGGIERMRSGLRSMLNGYLAINEGPDNKSR